MDRSSLHSIGYGNRGIAEFIALLRTYGIDYLIDVRSKPWSRFNPDFKKAALSRHLEAAGIRYVFMGAELGGMPGDPALRNAGGKVDYAKVAADAGFREGIGRLKTAHARNVRAAVMCAELRPEQCHRARLIGKALLEAGIVLQHIDERGKVRDQHAVANAIPKGKGSTDLFGDPTL